VSLERDLQGAVFYSERMAEMTEETTNTEMVEEKATETEAPKAVSAEEFEKMQKALKEANKEAAARRKKLEELEAKEKERQDAELSEIERLKKQNAELETKQKQLEHEQAKQKAALEAGLDPTLYDRIKGDTPEEMLEDAKSLAKLLPQKSQKQKLDSANPASSDKGPTDAERAKFLGLRR